MTDHSKPYIDVAIRATRDLTLSPEQAADEIVKQCRLSIESGQTVSDQASEEGDTPSLEDFLWWLWGQFVSIAQEDVLIHDRIAYVLAALKAKGTAGCEGWRVWGVETSWSRLPVFGLVCREDMNGPQPFIEGRGNLDLTAPKAQALLSGDAPTDDEPDTHELVKARRMWLNMNAFLARLWALDVVDEAFFGIACMRMQLEPLTLCSTSKPTADPNKRDGIGEPQELQIEVAASWLRIAGAKMHACTEIMGAKGNTNWDRLRGCPGGSGGTWDGVDGYHPDRWRHWKGILQEVMQGEWRRNVIEAARAAVEAMETYEQEAASE